VNRGGVNTGPASLSSMAELTKLESRASLPGVVSREARNVNGSLLLYACFASQPIAREPHIRPAGKMRLIHAAVAGFIALATAKSNLTQGSKNVLPSTFQPPQHFRNTNLVRNINLEKNYPRETINVVVENIDKKPQSEYYLPFEQHVIGRIGGLEAKDKKDASKAPFNVEIVALDEGR
jgi:hypothetical protein